MDKVIIKETKNIVKVLSSGKPGPQGAPGQDGSDGSRWFDGEGNPNTLSISANAGDYFLENITGDVYVKLINGTWEFVQNLKGPIGNNGSNGINGTNGVDGEDGKSAYQVWLDEGNTGTISDFLNSLKGEQGEQGPAGTNGIDGINGVNGTDGATIRNGNGVPSNSLGNNGDYYLNNLTDDFYFKSGGVYSIVANFKGEQGEPGQDGVDGTNGINGQDGKSAYQVWLDEGNTGTEQDFLDSIKGETGEQGPAGSNGTNGIDGSQFRNGSGAPSNTLGINGDYYLDTVTGELYFKSSGTYSIIYELGTGGGGSGSTIRNGVGAPSNSLGVDGDYYLDTATSDFYFKSSGTYSIIVNLKGQDGVDGTNGTNGTNGIDGTQIRVGNDNPPVNTLGVNGDFYYNNSLYDLYQKIAGGYVLISNLKGLAGSKILLGTDNPPTASIGANDDIYINTSNYDLYQKIVGGWVLSGNIKGADGTGGSDGTPGSQIRTGTGAPSNSLGINGDYYIDTSAGTLYFKSSGTYSIIYTFGSGGASGAQLYSGTTNPDNSLGNDGDIYINTVNHVFFKKISGSWEGQFNLQGTQFYTGSVDPNTDPALADISKEGDLYLNQTNKTIYKLVYDEVEDTEMWEIFLILDGFRFYNGTLNPDDPEFIGDLGSQWLQGDYYLKTDTGELWYKNTGSTQSVIYTFGSGSGVDGKSITTGTGAPSNSLGNDGDLYINLTNYDLYQKSAGIYSIIGNIKGTAGTNGTNGVDGSQIRTDTGVPSNALGVNGDYYIDTASGILYKKSSGTYTSVYTLGGAPGGSSTQVQYNNAGSFGGASKVEISTQGNLLLTEQNTTGFINDNITAPSSNKAVLALLNELGEKRIVLKTANRYQVAQESLALNDISFCIPTGNLNTAAPSWTHVGTSFFTTGTSISMASISNVVGKEKFYNTPRARYAPAATASQSSSIATQPRCYQQNGYESRITWGYGVTSNISSSMGASSSFVGVINSLSFSVSSGLPTASSHAVLVAHNQTDTSFKIIINSGTTQTIIPLSSFIGNLVSSDYDARVIENLYEFSVLRFPGSYDIYMQFKNLSTGNSGYYVFNGDATNTPALTQPVFQVINTTINGGGVSTQYSMDVAKFYLRK